VLAVRFGVMCQLIGFDREDAEIAKTKRQMCDGTHSGRFCVFAIDMIELLRQMGAQSMPLDIVAELTVSVKRDAGTMTPGVESSDRRARRSPEVQKFARRVCQLVESIRARFPPADLATLCDKRRLHVGALEAIFERMVKSLHTAAPAAGMAGETGTDGYAELRFETIFHSSRQAHARFHSAGHARSICMPSRWRSLRTISTFACRQSSAAIFQRSSG